MKHPGFYPPVDKWGFRHECSKCGAVPTVCFSSLCDSHYRERHAHWSPIALRAAQVRRERYPHMHVPSGADLKLQAAAHRAVYLAVQRGDLPRLDGTIKCTDCPNKARHYDHRDYTKPLDVQPVCVSCNRLRGTALWGHELRPDLFGGDQNARAA
jgi:hypothetical protein